MAGPNPLFFPVPIVEAWDETPHLRGLRLRLPAHGEGPPGQVVQLRCLRGRAGYFALASAPSADGAIELLVKRGGPLADEILRRAHAGETLEATLPFGRGFPTEEARGRDVLLFATGSGIAPIRALVQRLAAERAHVNRVSLFYGQRSEADFAFAREHEGWRRAGVDLHLCCSRPTSSDSPVGYVQNVARATLLRGPPPANAVAFVAGLADMVAGVKAALAELGVPEDRVFQNH